MKKNRRLIHGHCVGSKPTKVYNAWQGLLKRAYFKHSKYQPHYANISVCKRWLKFENFLADMGEPPTPIHQLDRINNLKGYSPTNCRWATVGEQARNRRSNRKLRYKGQTFTLIEWSIILKINRTTLGQRLKRGWSVARALSSEIDITKRNHRYE